MLHYLGQYAHFLVHTGCATSRWEQRAIFSDMQQHFLKTSTTKLNKQ